MSKRLYLPAALILATATLAACTGGGAGTPLASPATGQPSASAAAPSTPAASPQGLAHPTGATDVILSYDQSGGFVMPEFLAAHVPIFTLYGDGTVVFVQTTAQVDPRADGIATGQPVRTAKLTEEQVQALLLNALQEGGLAVAKTQYQNQMVADASTAVFTISADNDTKTVSAYGLGMDQQPSADSAVLKQLAGLAERLGNFDQNGSLASAPYEATRYKAVLTDQAAGGVAPGGAARPWPWANLTVKDFAFPADANALQQGVATLTAEQAKAIGVDGFENGIAGGLTIKGDDGKTYSLVIRPLLPGEKV